MKKRAHQSQQSQNSNDPVQMVDTVPALEKLPEVDGLTALAASFRYMDNNPGMRDQVASLITTRAAEIMADLERDDKTEMFLVSERNVRAIFSKATHETLGLITLGVGSAMANAEALQDQFSVVARGDNGDTKSYEQPELAHGF